MVDEPVIVEPGLLTWREIGNGGDTVVLRDGNAPDAGESAVQADQKLPLSAALTGRLLAPAAQIPMLTPRSA